MLSAEDLHSRGLAHSNSGRYASARTLLRRALERAEAPDLVAKVKLSLGYVEAELGSTDAGLALCADALETPRLSRHVRGLVESQIALLKMRAGAGPEALTWFARAIALLGESPEPRARAYLNRGLLYLQRGDAVHAEEDSRLAAALYREAGDEVTAAMAEHNLGYARLLAGDLVAALRLMESSAPLLETLSATYRAVVAQDRAEVLVAAGMPGDAQVAFAQAARAYGSRRLRQRQAEVELILARSLAWDDPRRAALVAARAERRFRQRGSDTWSLRAEVVKLAAQIDGGRTRAIPGDRAEQLAAQLNGQGLHDEALLMTVSAAKADLAIGRLDEARRHLDTTRSKSTTPIGLRMLAREVRAEVVAAGGRRGVALQHVRRGLDELHEWQSSFGSLDLQSSLVGHGRRLARSGLRLALADGRPEVVFEWSERARALATRVTAVRPAPDLATTRALTELRQTRDEALAGPLRTRIRQQAWYGAGSGQIAEPADLERVQRELAGAEAVLTSYLVIDDTLLCLVVADGVRQVRSLGRFAPVRAVLSGMQADLDMAATDLPPALRTVVTDALGSRLRALDALIVKPLRELVGAAERVAVIPPAPLAGTPWTMLPGLREAMVTVPRSASLWVEERQQPLRARRLGLVAGPRVERAEEEVRRAAAVWPRRTTSTLAGDQATASAVSALIERVDVLHVAAHGRHSADNPLFSGLELADGPWFGYDIDQVAAIPSTVILSSCELGRSSVRWGLETIGMTVAWQHAGARCVIAAPASVADDVACEVLAGTHAGLAVGRPPAEALRDAIRAEAAAAHRSIPGASFVCYGAAF